MSIFYDGREFYFTGEESVKEMIHILEYGNNKEEGIFLDGYGGVLFRENEKGFVELDVFIRLNDTVHHLSGEVGIDELTTKFPPVTKFPPEISLHGGSIRNLYYCLSKINVGKIVSRNLGKLDMKVIQLIMGEFSSGKEIPVSITLDYKGKHKREYFNTYVFNDVSFLYHTGYRKEAD